MTIELGFQEVHLVSEDAAIGEREKFGPVGYIGYRKQWHCGLLRCAATFTGVATAAGADHIGPAVEATSRQRHDMVAGQLLVGEYTTAVETEVVVAAEQFVIAERRYMAVWVLSASGMFDCDDRMHGDAGAFGLPACVAAVECEGVFTSGPGDQIATVEAHRILPRDPADRRSGNIESQYERCGHDPCECVLHCCHWTS